MNLLGSNLLILLALNYVDGGIDSFKNMGFSSCGAYHICGSEIGVNADSSDKLSEIRLKVLK